MTSDLATIDRLRRRMRGWAGFFLVVGGITMAAGLVLVLGDADEDSYTLNLGRMILAAAILAGALAAYNSSRAGALFLLATLLVGFTDPVDIGNPASLGAFVRTCLYALAGAYIVWTVFRYVHLARRQSGRVAGSGVARWTGVGTAASVFAFLSFGLSVETSDISTEVVSGARVTAEQAQWMIDNGIMLEQDEIFEFYSEGLYSISEGGQMLTDSVVVAWSPGDEEQQIFWTELGQICDIEKKDAGGPLADAIYHVRDADQDWFEIWLSTENGGDARFVARTNYLNRRKMIPEVKTACEAGEPIDWDAVAIGRGLPRKVVPGDQIADHVSDWLASANFLLAEETPLEFYTYAQIEIEEGGALLTDKYLGGWYQRDGRRRAWWSKLGEICEIERSGDAASEDFAKYRITSLDNESWLEISLATEDGGDNRLVSRALALNELEVADDHAEKCEAAMAPEADEAAGEEAG